MPIYITYIFFLINRNCLEAMIQNKTKRKCSIVKKIYSSIVVYIVVATCSVFQRCCAVQRGAATRYVCRSGCCSPSYRPFVRPLPAKQPRSLYSRLLDTKTTVVCAAAAGVRRRAAADAAELIELYRLLLQLSDRFRCVRMHRDFLLPLMNN